MKLENRVALVTGGSSGIGRGIALELAAEGARVAVADVREDPKRGKYHEQEATLPTAREITRRGGEAWFAACDVSNQSQVRKTVEETVQRLGRLDIVVNNAGILVPGDSQRISTEDWNRVLGIDLTGVFFVTKHALPHLKKSPAGRIINIASVQAFGGGGGPAYAAAKAGALNLTRDTALEVAPFRITANAICPGYIETPIQDYLTEAEIEDCRKKTPLPRFGTPRDIGRAVVFLASDDAEWITGVALAVDGGWTAGF